jgi:HPr kinase/phosphorylase
MSSETKNTSSISIAEIIRLAPGSLELELITGEKNIDLKVIDSARIQKLGLAFAGFHKYLHRGRIHMIGQSEISYLSQLDVKAKSKAINNLELKNTNCILVTKKLDLPVKLLDRLQNNDVPVIRTSLVSSRAISCLSSFLQKVLAPQISIHGVMLGMYGLGILIIGESGIGKSECALDLIRAGHRLISDDSVTIKKIGDILEGSSPKLTYEHLEIRGLGILNVKHLYGISAVGQSEKIDLCIELQQWQEVIDIDRLGLKMQTESIFDIKIPKFVLPVSPGRNITSLVETAVRVHLLKLAGHNAAKKLIKKHSKAISRGQLR